MPITNWFLERTLADKTSLNYPQVFSLWVSLRKFNMKFLPILKIFGRNFCFYEVLLYICNSLFYFNMKASYDSIPNMFVVNNEPKEVTEIRATILDKFKDLIFEEGPHVYYLSNDKSHTFKSVTTRLGDFENEFNVDEIAERYALKHGETKEYWIDEWKFKNLVATTTGSMVHEYGESLGNMLNGNYLGITEANKAKFIKDKNWLIPTRPKEKAILSFFQDLNENLHFVLAEAKMYTECLKENLAGTADILFYYKDPKDDSKSGLCIFDYKTNAEITKSFSRENGKMLLPPFDDYYDEPKSIYTLQLSTYSIPLQDLGFNIIARRLVWLKDDGTYEIIPLKDESKRLRNIL